MARQENARYEKFGSRKKKLDFSLIYPIGSIYMSINNVDPGLLFGGTWEQIQDMFLLAAGDSYKAGVTGGEATHKLTAEEMPSHTHAFTGTAESHTHTFTGTAASHTHTFTGTAASHNHTSRIFNTNNKNFNMGISGVRLKSTSAYEWVDISSASDITTAGSTGGDNCGITRDTSITPKGTNTSTSVTPKGTNANTSVTPKGANANTGGGTEHNNMPPYLAVYMWKRTA